MLLRRKSLMAVAAAGAALAVSVPASAQAATPIVDPTVCQLLNIAQAPLPSTPGAGTVSLADVLARVGGLVGCSASTTPSMPSMPSMPAMPAFPAFPGFPGFPTS